MERETGIEWQGTAGDMWSSCPLVTCPACLTGVVCVCVCVCVIREWARHTEPSLVVGRPVRGYLVCLDRARNSNGMKQSLFGSGLSYAEQTDMMQMFSQIYCISRLRYGSREWISVPSSPR